MPTITAGEVRECCRTGSGLRIMEQTERLIVQRCETPAVDGLIELEGVRVCGRRHIRARLIGLGARAAGARLGD